MADGVSFQKKEGFYLRENPPLLFFLLLKWQFQLLLTKKQSQRASNPSLGSKPEDPRKTSKVWKLPWNYIHVCISGPTWEYSALDSLIKTCLKIYGTVFSEFFPAKSDKKSS